MKNKSRGSIATKAKRSFLECYYGIPKDKLKRKVYRKAGLI